jgi:leader peptidase (prepilin peptidase)/N-methyltransferase
MVFLMLETSEQLYTAVLAGLFGLMLGSFLNVVAHRLPIDQSPWSPRRSYCPHCETQLSALDNVPLLSYVMLRGRCRYCGGRISWRYPLVELTTGVLYFCLGGWLGLAPELAVDMVFVAMLVTITAADLEYRIIPDKVLLAAVAVGAPLQAWARPDEWMQWAFAAAIGFGVMLLIALAYPRGMGMGDVKLAGVMGLFLGKSLGPAMFVAFLSGTLVGIAVMLRKGVAEGRKTAVPFGPFMALGGVVAMFWGEQMVDAYLAIFDD